VAVIKSIRKKTGKTINPTSSTCMDVAMNSTYISFWTYSSGDVDGKFGSKQNIQLDHQMALQLREYLDEFLCR